MTCCKVMEEGRGGRVRAGHFVFILFCFEGSRRVGVLNIFFSLQQSLKKCSICKKSLKKKKKKEEEKMIVVNDDIDVYTTLSVQRQKTGKDVGNNNVNDSGLEAVHFVFVLLLETHSCPW